MNYLLYIFYLTICYILSFLFSECVIFLSLSLILNIIAYFIESLKKMLNNNNNNNTAMNDKLVSVCHISSPHYWHPLHSVSNLLRGQNILSSWGQRLSSTRLGSRSTWWMDMMILESRSNEAKGLGKYQVWLGWAYVYPGCWRLQVMITWGLQRSLETGGSMIKAKAGVQGKATQVILG